MIICSSETLDKSLFVQTVGFTEIIERTRMIAQLGVHKADEEVGIHRFEGFQIHTRSVNKAESG